MCENCHKRTADNDLTIPYDKNTLCHSYCDACYKSGTVCEECLHKGHTAIFPSIRSCKFCSERNLCCIKRLVMTIVVDCESGNKQGLKQFQTELEEGTIAPPFALSSVLPDVPHLLKTCKVNFAYWIMQIIGERAYISIVYTLRNRSEHWVRKEVRKYLPKNDYVRNRDRQDPTGVIVLCKSEFLEFISILGLLHI